MKFDGEKLRVLRLTKNMTQEQVAEGIGGNRVSVAAWEKGSATPGLATIGKLGEFLGVDGSYFITQG